MSAINEFRIVGIVSQNTQIKIVRDDNKVAYCVIKPINSEKICLPIIAFGDTAIKLNYLGKKGNMIQVFGSITSYPLKMNNKKVLEVSLVVNELNIIDIKKKTRLSDRDFTDLFKIYDLPKYNPPRRR